MSTLPILRSLSQAKLPMKHKSRQSSADLSLPISCAAPTRSLLKGASFGERARVRGVVGGMRTAVALHLLEGSFGGERMW